MDMRILIAKQFEGSKFEKVELLQMGKGSTTRPTNKSKFDENFDRIFGKRRKKKNANKTKTESDS